ncbi:hypothetical protein NDU88_003437 [Pleurodeles waltl]|uniref:Uncharacterized protein n=1 Tax=Pleurodeles waltl TaxID=8319 RepID=A0AAV7UEA7_PLEWA|nr:hypothetical protein NDU88_003437 [Pleurodeles waltl]
METRTEELEIEVKAATAQTTTQGQQISDIQWKLEDAENRQRRNNLRILGIAEDLEGQDTRAYIASLFKQAFPDLNDCELGQNGGNYVSTMRLPESRSLSYVLSVCKTGKFDYWDIRYIEENLETVYLTPQMVLLGVDHSVCNSRDRYFLFIAMSVFRNCIASLWRDVDPPRFNQWFSQLLSMYHLENSLYELKGAAACKRFTRAWAPLSVWLLGPENVPTI